MPYSSLSRNPLEMNIIDIDGPIRTISGYIFSGSGTFDALQFNLNPTTPSTSGLLRWNSTDGTLDLGLPGNVTLQVGQEMFIKVINKTGSTILNGKAVYFNGRQGNRPTIALAKSDLESTSDVMGITTEDILDNTEGYITTMGYVRQIKTDYAGWNEGDKLYVSKTIAGDITNIEPSNPHHSDVVGSVGVVGGHGIGSILVNINKHKTLEELSDVNGTPLTTSGQFPIWNPASGYFDFNKNINGYYPNTGFTNPENIAVHYNTTDRTISLSGSFQCYYHGDLVPSISGGYISPAHPSGVTVTQYLSYTSNSGVYWSSTPWDFDRVQIAMINYDTTGLLYAQRETHGMMPWETHEELHRTIGTYKESGGTLADYTIGSTTVRRPSISSCVIHDEDLETTINSLPSGSYTQFNLTGTLGSGVIIASQNDIVSASGNQPYYNEFTGSTWQQTLMSNNSYMCVWIAALPTTNDSFSQARRFLFVQGQSNGSLESQQGLSATSLNLNGLATSELVFITKIILKYLGGNWTIQEVSDLSGTRVTQTSSPAGIYLSTITTDSTINGLGTVSTPLSISGSLAAVNTNLVNASGLFIKRDASLPMDNPWSMFTGSYTLTGLRQTGDAFGSKKLYLPNADKIFLDSIDIGNRLTIGATSGPVYSINFSDPYPIWDSTGIMWADLDTTVYDNTYATATILSDGQIYDSLGIQYNNNAGFRIKSSDTLGFTDYLKFYNGLLDIDSNVAGQSGNSVQWNQAYKFITSSGLFLKKDGSVPLTANWNMGDYVVTNSGAFWAADLNSSGTLYASILQKRSSTTQSMTRWSMIDADDGALGFLDCGVGAYRNTFADTFVPVDNSIALYTYKSTPMYFGTSNRIRMSINAGGAVGIGLNGGIDTAWLTVADGGTGVPNLTSLLLMGGDGSLGALSKTQIRFGYSNTDKYQHYLITRHNAAVGGDNNAFDFYTCDSTENGVFPTNAIHGLTINNGDILVGTSTKGLPSILSGDNTMVRVKGRTAGKTASLKLLSGDDLGCLEIGAFPTSAHFPSGAAGIGTSGNNPIVFYGGPTITEKMRILPNGYIGIGTSVAAAPVHIKKTGGVAGALELLRIENGQWSGAQTAEIRFYHGGDTSTWHTNSIISELINGVNDKLHLCNDVDGTVTKVLTLFGGNIILGAGTYSPYISATNTNTLNAAYDTATDTADMWINYRGYQDGTGYFRDFRLGDGKSNVILTVTGSSKQVESISGYYTPVTSDSRIGRGYTGNSYCIREDATTHNWNLDVYNRTTSAWTTPLTVTNRDGVISTNYNSISFSPCDGAGSVATDGMYGLYWHESASLPRWDYGMFRTSGSWDAPNYQQLTISFNTGIIIDGGSAYGKSGTLLQPSGGNVGIGVFNSSYKLNVLGNINCSGITVDTISYNKQSVTVADASADLTPTRHYIEVTNQNGGTCTITLQAGGMALGSLVTINYTAGYPYTIVINGKSGNSATHDVEGSSLWVKTSYGWQKMGSAT